MNEKRFWVYIMASGHNGTLYIGMTSNLVKRVWEHKSGEIEGFSKKYAVNRLVYFEECGNAENAARRERRLKKYARDWKKNLIERDNPAWVDLYENITACGG